MLDLKIANRMKQKQTDYSYTLDIKSKSNVKHSKWINNTNDKYNL